MEGSLVERARAGDADAFEELVRRRIDAVYRTAMGILGEPADARDATQDALVAAWRELPSLREPDRFDAWLHRITINCCRMLLRRRRRVREIRLATDSKEGPTAQTDPLAAAFDHAFERLTVEQRAILLEHHLDGRKWPRSPSAWAFPRGPSSPASTRLAGHCRAPSPRCAHELAVRPRAS